MVYVFFSVLLLILLIFRKKSVNKVFNNYSWLLKCRTSVGDALSQLLIENESEQVQFQIYKAENYFNFDDEWFILNKAEFDLLSKLNNNNFIAIFFMIAL